MVGAIHTQKPEVWIEIKQDKTIVIHAPEGCKIETDSEVEIKASQAVKVTAPKVEITGQVIINGTLTVSGDMSAGGKSYLSHTHKGDSGGTTSAPL
jgi:phage baseplate assembly protein V